MTAPAWRFVQHLNLCKSRTRNQHLLMHRDDALGVQRETVSLMSTDGMKCYGSETGYFIDGDEREFASQAEMLAALAKRGKQS